MSNTKYLIGIDIGTTNTKSILFQTDGKVIDKANQGYPTINSTPYCAEQNSEEWWLALIKTVNTVLEKVEDRTSVLAMAVSTQGGTLVPTDQYGNPLFPAILWSDSRCKSEREILLHTCNEEEIYKKTGWLLGNGLNALQILWLKNNRPDVFEKAAYFLSVPDFISMRLTRKPAIDASNGGINQLLDINRLEWDEKILSILGITKKQLPVLVESGRVIGKLSEQAAEVLGLTTQTLLVSGGHDQYCAALGAGAIHAGDSVIGTGTAWVATGVRNNPYYDFNTGIATSRHTVHGKWGSLLSLESGGRALEWFREKILADGDLPDYQTMDKECERRGVRAPQLLFYPYLNQCSFPSGNQEKKASFVGLTMSHDKYDMARAIMEGVAFQTVWMLETIAGKELSSIKMTGGAVNSKLWVQIVADISGIPVCIPKMAEVGCVGAAILAGVGIGIFADCNEGYKKMEQPIDVISPGQNAQLYQAGFTAYKQTFISNKQ